MGEIETLINTDWAGFFLALVALMGLFLLIVKVIEAVKSLRKPHDKREDDLSAQQKSCETKFANDMRRLEEHDSKIADLKEGERVTLGALHALLEHELHNGNAEEMRSASKAIFDYMNK